MIRVLISVEGKTEWLFVKKVLTPYFARLNIVISLHNMKGNIGLDRVASKLNGLVHNYDFVMALYGFYRFKKRGLNDSETKNSLEKKIKKSIKQSQQDKVIPYIQRYEFEAPLFSDAEIMANNLNVSQNWIDGVLNEFNDLEEINNSKETVPPKHIGKNAKYIKTQHALKILAKIGLKEIRKKYQGLNVWLTQLESLCE